MSYVRNPITGNLCDAAAADGAALAALLASVQTLLPKLLAGTASLAETQAALAALIRIGTEAYS